MMPELVVMKAFGKRRVLASTRGPRETRRERQFDIHGYETGAFRGIPNDYVKYCNCIPPQGCGFAFRHYIVIVEKWTIVSN